MARYQAILFDFDGVLMDSEPVHFASWVQALEPLGIRTDWDTFSKYCIGVPDRQAVETLCRLSKPPVNIEEAWSRWDLKKELFRARMLETPPISETVSTFLKSLASYRLAIVTASVRSEIEPLLERAGIRPCFGAVVCGEDVQRNKPAPDPYLLAAKLLDVSRALVVEDSDTGVASGQAAGFDVLRVGSPAEVPALVWERLNNFR